jgi:hypothetical protein
MYVDGLKKGIKEEHFGNLSFDYEGVPQRFEHLNGAEAGTFSFGYEMPTMNL